MTAVPPASSVSQTFRVIALRLALALSLPAAAAVSDVGGAADTDALDRLVFGEASTVHDTDRYRTTGMTLPSLNAQLWSKANVTQPETPFNSGGCVLLSLEHSSRSHRLSARVSGCTGLGRWRACLTSVHRPAAPHL